MLFTPFQLGTLALKNRIVVPPMVLYHTTDRSGLAREGHMEHSRALARGGAGLIIQEATCVCEDGTLSPDELGIWS